MSNVPFYRSYGPDGNIRIEEFAAPFLGTLQMSGKARFYDKKRNKYRQVDYDVTLRVDDYGANWLLFDPDKEEMKVEFSGAKVLHSTHRLSLYDKITGEVSPEHQYFRLELDEPPKIKCSCDGHTLLHYGHKCGL